MFRRAIKLPKTQSFFLFGPRGTGKSTLIKSHIPAERMILIDLLLAREESSLSQDPDDLERRVLATSPEQNVVVIDEIQKVPRLLDVVHRLIENTGKQFILTGSSARKLKAGAANLLAGRAFERHLHPLTHLELGESFDLQSALQWGTMPMIFHLHDPEDREDFLAAYANTYLKEEVWGEHLVRKLDPFRKFLQVAAQANGKILNYSRIAEAVGADTKTVQSYFQILEDTLLGFILEPYDSSVRRRVHKNPKFYFFDTGVARALAGQLKIPPQPSTAYFGELFEQFVILEFIRSEAYFRRGFRFFYCRTLEDQKMDLIIERPGQPLLLVEIKSADQLNENMLKPFQRVRTHFPQGTVCYCLSRDKVCRDYDGIRATPWDQGLREIFA